MSTDELLSVLNHWGQATGANLPKREVHRQWLWHAGVHLCITDGRGNIVQQLRGGPPEVKILPNVWDVFAVAGHVSAGESALQALLRETKEELGLAFDDVARRILRDFYPIVTKSNYWVRDPSFEDGGYWHRTYDFSYVLSVPGFDLDICRLEADKVIDVRWYSAAQLMLDQAEPGSKAYLQHAHRPEDDSRLYELLAKFVRGSFY